MAGAGGGGGLLPGLVASEGEDVGQDSGGDYEVGGFSACAGGVAEEVEGDGGSLGDEAGEEATGLFRIGQGRGGVGGAEGGLDQGGCG